MPWIPGGQIVEKSEILKSTLVIYQQENEDLRQKLQKTENREKDLMDENMKLYLDGIALRDEISLLIDMKGSPVSESTPKASQQSSGNLIIPVSTCPASSEDEGLGDTDSANRSREGSVVEEDDAHRSSSPEDDNSSSSSSTSSSVGVKSVFSSRSGRSVCLSSTPLSSPTASVHDTSSDKSTGEEEDSPGSRPSSQENLHDNRPPSYADNILFSDQSCQTDIHLFSPIIIDRQQDDPRFKVPLENHQKSSSEGSASSLERVLREKDQLKTQLEKVSQERDSLMEQVLELEEAENDARFSSQRLEVQVAALLKQIESLQVALTDARTTVDEDRKQLRHYQELIQKVPHGRRRRGCCHILEIKSRSDWFTRR